MPDTEPVFTSATRPEAPTIARPSGKAYSEARELGPVTVIAAFAIGAALGAGAALLYAPDSGRGTRRTIRRRVRKLTRREKSAWARLRRTLKRAAASRRKAAPVDTADGIQAVSDQL